MSFKATIEADIKGFTNNIDKAISSVDKLEKTTLQKLSKVGDSFVKIGAKASILSTAVVGATVGFVKMGIDAGNASAEINNLSTATSLSTDVIQELAYVATASNSSFEGLQSSMNSFQRRLKTVGEEGSRVNEMFGRLGVSTTDASGKTRSMDDVLLDTFNKLGDMEEGLAKNAIGAELFGRSWNEVSLIVSSGSKGIAELRKEANKLGLVLDENTLQSSDNFATAMELVGFQIDKIKSKIGAGFVPILEETVLPLLQDKVIPAVSRFADFIGQLAEKFNALSPSTKTAIFALGGIATAVGPLLLGLGGLLKILPLIGAGFTAITGPVGIAVAAVAGAAALIISNWDSIKEYFTAGGGSELFDSIKSLFITVKNIVSDVFHEIKNTITTVWNAIGDTIKKIWGNSFDSIVATITIAVDTVRGVLNTLISLLKGDFSGALESIKTLAKDVFDGFKRIVFNSLSSMTAALSKFFSFLNLNSLAETFADWSEKIKPSTKKIVEDIETVNDEIEQTSVVADTATQSITGLAKELDTFQKLIGEQLNVRDAVTKTVATIEDLQSKLVKLQLGILPSTNVRQELAETQQQINDLSVALDLLTGGRELNIKVNANISGIEAAENKFLKDGAIVVPPIDTSLLENSLGQAKEMVAITSQDLGSLLSAGISSFAQTIGDAFAGNWDGLGAGLLRAVGSLAQQFGGLVVGMGVAALKLQSLITNPLTAIAAGSALIALGAAASKAAQKMISSATGGAGYSSAPSLRETGPSYGPSDYRGPYQDDFNVEFVIKGDNLVGVLDTAQQRRKRL